MELESILSYSAGKRRLLQSAEGQSSFSRIALATASVDFCTCSLR